jgi:hypothetical protein
VVLIVCRCENCREVFEEPNIYYSTVNLDGENGWYKEATVCCPYCGWEGVEDIRESDD